MFPVLIAVLFAALAMTALGVVLVKVDDGDGVDRTASSTPSSIPAAPAAATVAPAAASTMPADTTTSSAPPAPPTAATAGAPVAPPTPPSTTTAPLTNSPTVATTSAPTASTPAASPIPAPAAPITSVQAESFVRGYYDAVAAGDYARSWSQLTPEFQSGKARSYDYYIGFWDDNDITVDHIELVDTGPSSAIVHVDLRWNGSSDATTNRFELRRGPDGQWLIARQDTIAG